MDIENCIPLFVSHLLDDAVPGVAGIVHHDVGIAEGLDRGFHDALAEVDRGDVTIAGDRLTACFADQGDGLECRCLIDIVDHDLCAGPRQSERDLLTDAATRSGDDGHAAVELSHAKLLSGNSDELKVVEGPTLCDHSKARTTFARPNGNPTSPATDSSETP